MKTKCTKETLFCRNKVIHPKKIPHTPAESNFFQKINLSSYF